MFSLAFRLNRILTAHDRALAGGVLVIVLAMAGIEVLGIGSVFWFVSALAEPDAMIRLPMLAWLHQSLGTPPQAEFVITVGGLLLAVMVARNAMQLLTIWAQQRFVLFRNHAFAHRLLHAYLAMPYAFYLKRHTAELSKNILNEVSRVASGILYPLVEMATSFVILFAILVFLFLQDAAMTAVIAGAIGLVSFAGYLPLHRLIGRLGTERLALDALRFKAAADALSGIKDARVLGRTGFFLGRFATASNHFFRREMLHKVLSQLPHFALETIAFALILGLMLFAQSRSESGAVGMLSTLSLYAVAAYRLLPQVKNIVRDATILRYSESSLDLLAEDLRAGRNAESPQVPTAARIPFETGIEFDNVTFRYDGAPVDAVTDLSLTIPCRSSAAFVGPTGAGKTTIVDLILGLFLPIRGSVRIDGSALTSENVPQWQANVGYVPQSVFLTDDSIRRNIAFGVPDGEIDDVAVRRAARMAQIDQFIEQLPEGYGTEIGERGTRLSGGERQRIGIARALYGRPRLLVLDEGTSALDGSTERAVAAAIANLTPEITVILIAHRLATVRACDTVFLVDRGRVVDRGRYDDLVASNADFRAMAQLA